MDPLIQTSLIVILVLAALLAVAGILASSLFSFFLFLLSFGKNRSLSGLMKKYEKGLKRFFYGVFLFLGALFIFSYLNFAFADVVLSQLLIFLPKAFVSLLVLYFGYISYYIIKEFVSSGVEDLLGYGVLPMLAGNSVGAIVLSLFASISLDLLGLDSGIIKIFLVTLLLTVAIPLIVLLASASKFIGGSLGVGYSLKFLGLKEGKVVKFGKIQGPIETISPTHVRIKTKKGTAIILSKSFLEKGWEEV